MEEPEIPEIKEVYVIYHKDKGYSFYDNYNKARRFTREISYAEFIQTLNTAEKILEIYHGTLKDCEVRKVIICMD